MMRNVGRGGLKAIIGAWVGLSLLVAMLAALDADTLQAEQEQYCQMVGAWKQEARMGVPPDQRSGWPDFKGSYEEACE